MGQKLGKRGKKRMAQTMRQQPTWLKTVIIAKTPRKAKIPGKFGAASPVVHIDPATGLPREG